jgi:N-acetylglucosaminyldiphosphoundecaprenol N-acetyl-beta-D-mannosaminyltransferase
MTPPSQASLSEICHVLSQRVNVVDYDSALAGCISLLREDRPASVTAANTHLIALARQEPDFGRIMHAFDLVLPDGMPLVWAMRSQGANLKDRVYGPYFMRHVIQNTPAPYRHFFFGSTEATLQTLLSKLRELQPNLLSAGTYSPPFRAWTATDEETFARVISTAAPDFIWVCLGGEKQERWIICNLHRHHRGVFLGVGDAFKLLAGERPFAPRWMQRAGLTWMFRFLQEPGRLWQRYVRFNSLFLYYSIVDRLRKSSTARS